MKQQEKTLWTIGHSTRTLEELIAILHVAGIELLADIRNYPGSRRYPHFNKDVLEASLRQVNIVYLHFAAMGGRRKALQDSVNTAWRHTAFRGYADHMETDPFKKSAAELEDIAVDKRTVIMCSEAVWWHCHRALVADYFKSRGWKVMHIMQIAKHDEHPYTQAARIVGGQLNYGQDEFPF